MSAQIKAVAAVSLYESLGSRRPPEHARQLAATICRLFACVALRIKQGFRSGITTTSSPAHRRPPTSTIQVKQVSCHGGGYPASSDELPPVLASFIVCTLFIFYYMEEEEEEEEEARYVKVASRFFLAVGDDAGCAAAGRHFLDACFLCKRGITSGRHIFMYKGDAAFCSDDCRQEQRDMDAALKALRRTHRMLMRSTSLPAPSSASASSAPPPVVPRRPTVVVAAAHSLR